MKESDLERKKTGEISMTNNGREQERDLVKTRSFNDEQRKKEKSRAQENRLSNWGKEQDRARGENRPIRGRMGLTNKIYSTA